MGGAIHRDLVLRPHGEHAGRELHLGAFGASFGARRPWRLCFVSVRSAFPALALVSAAHGLWSVGQISGSHVRAAAARIQAPDRGAAFRTGCVLEARVAAGARRIAVFSARIRPRAGALRLRGIDERAWSELRWGRTTSVPRDAEL